MLNKIRLTERLRAEACGCGHEHSHGHSHEDEHEHHHSDSCSCGHEHAHDEEHEHHHHNDSCGCGHEHSHGAHDEAHVHHHHGDSCGCGHEHSHGAHDEAHVHHHHGDSCGCGHDHSHGHAHEEAHEHHHAAAIPDGYVKKIYLVENLGCANCAAKMEAQIQKLPGVADATITFATKQLRVAAANPDSLLSRMQEICASIEPEVKLVPRTRRAASFVTRTYLIDNLDCANCAAKMESRINDLPEVEEASITFATKQLRVTAADPDALVSEMLRLCRTIEPDVTITPKESRVHAAEASQTAPGTVPAKKSFFAANRKDILSIGFGALLFIAGEILLHMDFELASLLVLVAGYVILGGEIVLTAVRNLFKGQVFDENFLMSIATLGAFVIREYPEAVGVMLFYRVGEFFEHVAVERSRSQIMDAVDMRPEVVNLVSGDNIRVIPAENARVGDTLLVRPGDRIPLDGTVLEGESRIDTSPVTGEPVPVKVSAGSSVTSGCVNTSGLLKIRADKVLEESMVTRILDSVENAAARKPKIDRFITRFARIYTPFVVILALCTAVIPSLVTGDWNHWVYTALSFLVISCPCALVLSVPLAFFSGIGAGSKKGILFKGGLSLEAIATIKAIVMDKTGTITKGNFVVQDVVPAEGISPDQLLSWCASCESASTHPIGESVKAAAADKGLDISQPLAIQEIAGQGIRAQLPDGVFLCGNRKLMESEGISMNGYPNTGFGTEVLVARDGVFIGHLVISDTIKEGARSAIGRMKNQGIVTAMLTGDARESAEAVARETGIDEVHARLLPQEKLSELEKIRTAHGSVMFVGDGINDAPVLAGADVGAAMGSGADAAIEAADVVFMTSDMEAIPQAIAIAKSSRFISMQNVVFALVVKVLVMILGLFGIASMWLAVFADTGVAMLCVLNSIRILYKK